MASRAAAGNGCNMRRIVRAKTASLLPIHRIELKTTAPQVFGNFIIAP